MSYTKTNWQAGDIITSEKLNKIENALTENNVNIYAEFTLNYGEYNSETDSTPIIISYNGELTANDLYHAIYEDGKNVVGVLRYPGWQDSGIAYSTFAKCERTGSMGAFGQIDFYFVLGTNFWATTTSINGPVLLKIAFHVNSADSRYPGEVWAYVSPITTGETIEVQR